MKTRASSARIALCGALTVGIAFSLLLLSSVNANNSTKTPTKTQAASATSPVRGQIASEAFGKVSPWRLKRILARRTAMFAISHMETDTSFF